MQRPSPPPPIVARIANGLHPVTWLQTLIVLCVLGSSLWLGLEGILASEAVASIFTASLGYVFTAGVQERTARQATEAVTEAVRPAADAASAAATSASAAATHAASAAVSAEGAKKANDG